MSKSKVTIKDIAQLAGVSRGTVDRVLNKRGKVGESTKASILKIADELGYQKNMIARNLALNQKKTVHIVIPNHHEDHFWTMVFGGIMSNMEGLQQFNVDLVFFQFDLYSIKDYLEKLRQASTDTADFVLIAPVFTKETLHFLRESSTPVGKFLAINSEFGEESKMVFVGQDSYKAGQIAARLFYNSIHKQQARILCLTLGHDGSNAIHIQKKMEGLQAFNTRHDDKLELIPITIEAFRDQQELTKICRQLEVTYPTVDGIFFTNSRATPFVRISQYFSQEQRPLVVGFDLIQENVNLLRNGTIDYLLDEQPSAQGRIGLSMIFNHLIYSKSLQPTRYLPINIVIKENLDDYLT